MSEAPAKNSWPELVGNKGETAKETIESGNPIVKDGTPTTWNANLTEKRSWPELVGTKGETAKETIESENPALDVIIMKYGSPAILNYVSNRVRVLVDENGVVVSPPSIG